MQAIAQLCALIWSPTFGLIALVVMALSAIPAMDAKSPRVRKYALRVFVIGALWVGGALISAFISPLY